VEEYSKKTDEIQQRFGDSEEGKSNLAISQSRISFMGVVYHKNRSQKWLTTANGRL